MTRALLVAAGGGLGDALVASLCVAALRERYDAVDAVTLPAQIDAFNHGSGVDELFSAMEPATELARKLRRKRYAAAVVTWATPQTAWLALRSGAPQRVGQARRLYSGLFTRRVVVRSEAGDATSHWSDILLDYARALGCDTPLQVPHFAIKDVEHAEAERLLRTLQTSGEFFLVHVTCAATPRRPRWPLAGWRDLVARMQRRYGLPVILSGARPDRPLVAALAAQTGAASAAGRTSVGGFAALAQRSRGFVVMHSGPMHVAAAVGTPTVGVFPLRVDFPDRWRPLGPRVEVVRNAFPCPPGRDHLMETCASYECIAQLDVAAAMRALDDVLERPRPSLRAGFGAARSA